jgi:hypothetical protein
LGTVKDESGGVPPNARIEPLLDVFNVFNNTAEERLADDNLFSQNVGRPSVFVVRNVKSARVSCG